MEAVLIFFLQVLGIVIIIAMALGIVVGTYIGLKAGIFAWRKEASEYKELHHANNYINKLINEKAILKLQMERMGEED